MGTSTLLLQQSRAESTLLRTAPRCLASIAPAIAFLILTIVPTTAQTPFATPARVLLLCSFGQDCSPWNHIPARFRAQPGEQSWRPIDFHEFALQNVEVDQPRDQRVLLGDLLFAERDVELAVPAGGVGDGPIFRLQEFGDKIAGGALRIVDDEGGDNNVPLTKAGAPIYDWRELQRWDISERRLAAGSEISLPESTLWDQYRWQISLVVSVILLQTGLIAGLLYEHRRRRTAEESARNSMTELAHVNRLATAGELSASVAHEISQPLTSILAHAQAGLLWLAGARPQIDEARTTFQDIVEAGHHAAEVVQNLRTFVRQATPQNMVLNVNELIRGVLSLAAADLRKHDISVVAALADGLPPILGDGMQLKQVLMNLVTNAAEAMETVTDRPRTLHLTSIWDPRGRVQVRVEDSGPGIAPNDLERIFVAFHTTKADGMGVGLSISRSIVEAHHGRLWASAGARFGAVFHLELPADGSHGVAEQVPPFVTQPADTAAGPIEPTAN